jgi:lysophospholipase L1-like esterase
VRPGGAGAPGYVALGDSISIDEYAGGPGRGGASLLFRNRDEDFPAWRGRDLATTRPELGFWLLAVDGGTTRTLLDLQLPALAAADVAPVLVTLTVGGNDLLAAYGDTRAALAVVAVVRSRVGEALSRLRDLAPADTAVALGTVYDPSDGTGDAGRAGLPPWPDVVAVLADLNEALRAVAQQHAARVADVHGRFLGHGLERGDVSQADPRPKDRELWYCDVIEPNAWGAGAVRAAFWDALG